MAEAAILAALKVIGDVLASKLVKKLAVQTSNIGLTFANLKANINNISRELRVMKGYLDELDGEGHVSHEAWVKEVQNSANCIEDIVSEFAFIVGNKKFDKKLFYVRTMTKKPKVFMALKRIASELSEVENNLKHLAKLKKRWVTKRNTTIRKNLEYSNDYSRSAAVSAHFIDEDNIVGIKQNRELITNWVISEEPQLSLISVWGMGGVGKTTLVANVFNRERTNFDRSAWVSISQSYSTEHILRNIISEIGKIQRNFDCEPDLLKETTNMDLKGLKEELRKLLKGMKYFIFLDDMWFPSAFQDISDTLIDDHRGSRIVITTRIAAVANLAPESNRLELKPLSEDESWDLFSIKTFANEKNHECPPPLKKFAKEIVSKCDGLPLALVSLGGVFSLLDKTESEWKRVYDQLSEELYNNPNFDSLKNILMLSFNYLPKYLKNCFLYCGLFPEDSFLPRKRLLRLWIGEGFIEQKGRSTLEEVAEGYLQQLIQRSMLQVVKRNTWGRVKRCRMHDTLRELAISLRRKENFVLLQEDSEIVSFNDNSVRRLSIDIKPGVEISHDVYLPRLRTFMSIDHTLPIDPIVPSPLLISSILENSRFLAVLNLEGLLIETVPDAVGDWFNLRYLGLRGTKVKLLPKSVEKLTSLQTLDLMFSKIEKVPDGIEKLKKLRHLFAQFRVDPTYKTFRSLAGISLPRGICYLKELQTLQALESNAIIVRELRNLTQLRSFRILNVKENHSAELCSSLSNMRSLSYLSIHVSNENEFLQLEGLRFLPQLQKLRLFGRLKEQMLESPLFKNSGNAIQLRLGWSQLVKDPLPSLSRLENLTWLTLQKAYEGTKLNFRDGWFPKLKFLSLRLMPNLVQVEMEQGTMVILEKIQLWELEQLKEIPKGIQHLKNLKRMVCKYMPDGFGDLTKGPHPLFHFRCHVL